jgi:hypothetical protein
MKKKETEEREAVQWAFDHDLFPESQQACEQGVPTMHTL